MVGRKDVCVGSGGGLSLPQKINRLPASDHPEPGGQVRTAVPSELTELEKIIADKRDEEILE